MFSDESISSEYDDAEGELHETTIEKRNTIHVPLRSVYKDNNGTVCVFMDD